VPAVQFAPQHGITVCILASATDLLTESFVDEEDPALGPSFMLKLLTYANEARLFPPPETCDAWTAPLLLILRPLPSP
jgi:hypothetical protein